MLFSNEFPIISDFIAEHQIFISFHFSFQLIDNVPNLENAIKLAHEFTNGNEQAIQLTRELHNECNPSAINPNR